MKKSNQFKPPRSKGNSVFRIPRLYDTPEWKEYSKKFLIHNPKCYACGNTARAVDHFKAFKKDKNLFWDIENMLPLCNECHNTVTANFDKFNPPKTKEKLEWINNKRLQTETSIKVKVTPINYRRVKDFEDFTEDLS